ncbi:MAG: DEAD/DEAH box helicase family protein [Bacteroidales bacterium]|nr:DEAD/DEAH box helicase family protein [Bacteroidales bacterium]
MEFDFASGLTSTEEEIIIDPEEIFRRQASGKNLWLGQGDILRNWHENREKNDVLIAMDTGMGKTIVGLLIAYSIMNEKKRKVIYLCASKQLVKQTVDEANELGIQTASYLGGNYTQEFEFHECKVPLITTYQALFNSKSKFYKEDIGGIVFDDSHVSGSVLKDSFTLSISTLEDKTLYMNIANLFKSYFDTQRQDVRYKQILENKSDEVFILPPFEVENHLAVIKQLLLDTNVEADSKFLFAWKYIKDNLDMCLFLINSKRIEIVPPVIPSKTLPYFQDDTSRVYLSATHVGLDYFPKYYGNKIRHFISFPSGKSKSKKFIISPYKTGINIDDINVLRKLVYESISCYRALIITPSFQKGKKWKVLDENNVLETTSQNIIDKIIEFKESDNKKLLLANRYDGIDFPGESCRVLVFDGLPSEGELLNSYFSIQLKANNYIRSEMNAKILQGIGRIFRGTDDFGIVILLGKDEVKWVSTPKNKIDFPQLMQVQLAVGNKLNEMINKDNFSDLISQILTKNTSLIGAYDRFIDEETKKIERGEDTSEDEKKLMEKVSLIESHIYSSLWSRNYDDIDRLCEDLVTHSKNLDSTTNAWHYFISAMALSVSGNIDKSNYFYSKAYSLKNVLPKIQLDTQREFIASKTLLINSITNNIENFDRENRLNNLKEDFEFMNEKVYPSQDKKHELGIELLGKYLGFETERPDNEHKTGPDVLWVFPNNRYVILELKTNKTTGAYPKKETSQSLDHVEWVKQNKQVIDDSNLCKIIIGPHNQVNKDANPSQDTWVIELDEFYQYANRLIQISESCYSSTFSTTEQIEELVFEQKLDWDNAFDSMNKVLAVDLK